MESFELITDYYEFAMIYALYKQNKHKKVGYYDVFVRTIPDAGGYYIYNGLHKVINYLENFKFKEDQLAFLKNNGNFD